MRDPQLYIVTIESTEQGTLATMIAVADVDKADEVLDACAHAYQRTAGHVESFTACSLVHPLATLAPGFRERVLALPRLKPLTHAQLTHAGIGANYDIECTCEDETRH